MQREEPEGGAVQEPGGIATKLKQLAELRAGGALTEEEFAAAKAKALAEKP